MARTRRITSISFVLAVLVAAGMATLLSGAGPAGAFTPGEGTGKGWCAEYHGSSLGSYRDVYACDPGSKTAGKTPFDSVAGFQPTELANRFLYTVTGHALFDNDVAGNFVSLASAAYAIPDALSGAATTLPAAGDIVSMWGGRSKQKEDGSRTQVAVITAVKSGSSGWTITTLNQGDPSDTNGADGFNSITVSANRQTWSAEDGFYADFAWLKLATSAGSTTDGGGWLAAEAPQRGTQTGRLLAVACGSASSCTAVGTANGAATLDYGSGQDWKSVGVPVPASSPTSSSLATVSCATAASCVAGGDYRSAGEQQGLLLSGHGSSWTATRAPLPASAAASPDARVLAVACASSSSCVAVGEYARGKSTGALLLTGDGTSWSGRQAPLPSDAGTSPAARLVAVACPSAAACTAVGSYVDNRGNRQGMLVTLHGGSWTATRSPLPASATVPGAELSAVACRTATSCVAAGSYAADSDGLIDIGSGTSWKATEAPLPTLGAADPKATFSGVACASGTCEAVGSYADSSGSYQGVLLAVRGSKLTPAVAPLPSGAAPTQGSPGVQLTSVACSSASACVAVGQYTDTSGDAQTLLLSGAGPSWKPARAPVPTNAKTVGAQAQGVLAPPDLASVACPRASVCVAVGSYPARKPGMEGLIVTGSA